MRATVLLLLALLGAARAWNPFAHDDSKPCAYSKQDLYVCGDRYADTNGDHILQRAELEGVRDSFNFIYRWVIKLAGDVDGILGHCSLDGDTITRESYFSLDACMGDCATRVRGIDYYCSKQAKARDEDIHVVLGHDKRRVDGARMVEV